MQDSKHLDQGGILDCFVRRCAITFSRMLFEDLADTFSLFSAFRSDQIPPEHPINTQLDEMAATGAVFRPKRPATAQTGGKEPRASGSAIGHFLR